MFITLKDMSMIKSSTTRSMSHMFNFKFFYYINYLKFPREKGAFRWVDKKSLDFWENGIFSVNDDIWILVIFKAFITLLCSLKRRKIKKNDFSLFFGFLFLLVLKNLLINKNDFLGIELCCFVKFRKFELFW